MPRKILVPVDGSEHARQAASLGLALARALDASVTGAWVDEAPRADARRERLLQTLPSSWRTEAAAPGAGAEAPETLGWLKAQARSAHVPVETRTLEGVDDRPEDALLACLPGHELVVMGALGEDGAEEGRRLGAVASRLARHSRVDALVVKSAAGIDPDAEGTILCCIDGSPQSFAGLKTAIDLARRLPGKTVEAVAVYDPYLHYTLFNGIVDVLSEKASKVFKFKDQEKLHEEIIDTGLAKIYQAHLEVARGVARDEGVDLKVTLLDGKAHQKVLKHARSTNPWLVVMGRIGVHSRKDMDIGATAENLLRQLDSNVLLVSREFVPPVDLQAQESVEWTPAATAKMERVPSFVRGVARTAVIRWAIERGHSIITPSVINACMGEILPPSAAQAMGYVAEELAKAEDERIAKGKTYICSDCGHAARDRRPVKCPVCSAAGAEFEEIDRKTVESLGKLEKGAVETEETFDGRKLHWTQEAKAALHRVPGGYERRRLRARVEKTAKVRGLETVNEAFVVDMVQQEVADSSYLSDAGEALKVELKGDEQPDDAEARAREGSPLTWTDAAWKRLCRVPEGFMRDMTRDKVEAHAQGRGLEAINLGACEDGIAEGRRLMADMIGQYGKGGATQEALRMQGPKTASEPGPTAEASGRCPAAQGQPETVDSEEGPHGPE